MLYSFILYFLLLLSYDPLVQEAWTVGVLMYILCFGNDPFANDQETLELDHSKEIMKSCQDFHYGQCIVRKRYLMLFYFYFKRLHCSTRILLNVPH